MRDEIKRLQSRTLGSGKWEFFKAKIKQLATTLGRREAKRGRAAQNRLVSTLRDFIEADKEIPGKFRDDIRVIKKELFKELEQHYWNALVRSRDEMVESEAQPSEIFRSIQRENARQEKTSLKSTTAVSSHWDCGNWQAHLRTTSPVRSTHGSD